MPGARSNVPFRLTKAAWAIRCGTMRRGCEFSSNVTSCTPAAPVRGELLADWDASLSKFRKVVPRDYRLALEVLEAERREAETVAAE